MRTALNWLSAAALAIMIGASHYLDANATFKIEDTTLATSYRGWTSTEYQSYKTCSEIGGPNVGFYYKDNGKLVCTTKRGYKLKEQP